MKKEKGMKAQREIVANESSPERRQKPKKEWQKPVLEDVSGKIMAQPYIRFT